MPTEVPRSAQGDALFGSIRRFGAQLRAARAANRYVREAQEQLATARNAEALVALNAAVASLRSVGDSVLFYGAKTSTLLRALTLRATTAAKLDDRQSALASIAEALALWGEVKPFIKPGVTLDWFSKWEGWARDYAQWANGSGPSAVH